MERRAECTVGKRGIIAKGGEHGHKPAGGGNGVV